MSRSYPTRARFVLNEQQCEAGDFARALNEAAVYLRAPQGRLQPRVQERGRRMLPKVP